MFQRLFDIIFSVVALIIFSPLIMIIALILKLLGQKEIFFLQIRMGRYGKPFYIYKFRTMQKGSHKIGTGTITLKNDPRILPFGFFLRKTKIDEFPQFFNILIGKMSFIGPRPLFKDQFTFYNAKTKKAIKQVRPGLSGISSIIFRNETQLMSNQENANQLYNEVVLPYKGKLEIWYNSHANIFTYFLLLFLTIWVIFFPSSNLVWRLFKDLPEPEDQLKAHLAYITKK